MASVSGTSSLGNTSLRGFGGMASGIDRDSIIEQMTLGTTTKISNKKSEMTSLQWKQEAYQSIIDKILDMEDNYFSYSSTTPLVDASFFGKNQITTLGDSNVTKYVTATGTSKMLDYVSILGVSQTATQATLRSNEKKVSSSITTGITDINAPDTCKSSNLEGRYIQFGTMGTDGSYKNSFKFSFPTTYKDDNGDTKTIDYTMDLNTGTDEEKEEKRADLKAQLNKALEQSTAKYGEDEISKVIEFDIIDDGNGNAKFQIKNKSGNNSLKITQFSSALNALGFNAGTGDDALDISKGISFDDFNSHTGDFEGSAVKKQTMAEFMTGKSLSVTYGGVTKNIELIKNGETYNDVGELAEKLQERLDKAFGKGNVKAQVVNDKLEFALGDKAAANQTLTINNGSEQVRDMLGITAGASNKISLDSTLKENYDKLGFDSVDELEESFIKLKDKDGNETGKTALKINDVEIEISADSTVNQLINAVNSSNAGVKATFLSATNQFVLMATETGTGREIDTGAPNSAAFKIFGGKGKDADGNDVQIGESIDGKNAKIGISYGNGIITEIESSTNTFNLEGLKVTVNGKFGSYDIGTGTYDAATAVTFNAEANVDAATERVKKFIEEYNALVTAVSTEMTTRPDSDYGPLTDEQKDEMDETSIENWETKAKQGLLFGDVNLRGLSDSLESMMVSFMKNGINTNDLKEIGISLSDDWYDGGQLMFDEAKFRDAMKSDPDKVANLICGGGNVKTGLVGTINNSLSTYATRFAYKHNGSYGSLVEVAGTSKLSRSLTTNQIYKQLKQMEEDLAKLKEKLSTEQDRYISQFSTMETLISQMNSQSSYLSSLSA